MVFIEKSTSGGLHYFEPNDLQKLESITPDNTLIFALVGKDAKDKVQFADIENLQGETLYDYELEIAHEKTDADTLNREELTNANKEFLTAEDQQKIYLDGENWFIRRVTMKESTAAHAMTGSGYAAYDAAIEIDRRDRRLSEAVRNAEGDNGLGCASLTVVPESTDSTVGTAAACTSDLTEKSYRAIRSAHGSATRKARRIS